MSSLLYKYLDEESVWKQFDQIKHQILGLNQKINSKNAWKLQIIDLLKPLCQKSNKDTLQVASTSIDISAKVYGIRVDDIHSEGLKLANSMARVSERMPAEGDDEDGVENDGDRPDEEGNTQKKKKKKKRVNLSGKKCTVSDSSKTHCGPLPKLEPIEFTTRVNADTGTMENLYTNTFKESSDSFLLLNKTKTMLDDKDMTIQNKENILFHSLPPLPAQVTKINYPFSDFRLDEWDPDNEEKQLGVEKSFQTQLQPVVFDDDGIPIPELDGSIHDIFENNDADVVDPDLNDDDDIQSIHEMGAPQLRNGEIARIVDFRSANETGHTSEYSYNSIINTHTGKFIDQIWAGPCHWKLKFLRRSTARFSGQQKSITSTKEHRQARKKAEPEMIDFTKEIDIDLSKKLVIKKKHPTADFNKITLPLLDQTCAKMLANIKELMLKPGVCPLEKKITTGSENEQLDYEVSPYKYENPNDSQYCAQSHDDDDNGAMDGPMEDHIGSDNEVEEHVNREQQCNLADNLVDNPEMVPKSYVAYAMKAKQMDMKRLKAAVWHFLTNPTVTLIDQETQQKQVHSTTFSKMYKDLPKLLPDKERRELSCPLAFVALLHLCNEKNLALEQISTYKDFRIHGPIG
ncbi:condensin complex subunit 2 isoform X2 [Leptinotarsa decemlineata]|uniref:condensin complex subunit 2 isoform X2 n=1 Tax=Leptinotarsa decemlineata TaxID=7539 RepID=UPI003D30B041